MVDSVIVIVSLGTGSEFGDCDCVRGFNIVDCGCVLGYR